MGDYGLDHVGCVVGVPCMKGRWNEEKGVWYDRRASVVQRKVVMVVSAPRGTLTLFYGNGDTDVRQVEAIRAFMECHNNGDKSR